MTTEPEKRKNPGRTGCPTKISNNHLCADDVVMVVSKKQRNRFSTTPHEICVSFREEHHREATSYQKDAILLAVH